MQVCIPDFLKSRMDYWVGNIVIERVEACRINPEACLEGLKCLNKKSVVASSIELFNYCIVFFNQKYLVYISQKAFNYISTISIF